MKKVLTFNQPMKMKMVSGCGFDTNRLKTQIYLAIIRKGFMVAQLLPALFSYFHPDGTTG
jgi:hypothetical protein